MLSRRTHIGDFELWVDSCRLMEVPLRLLPVEPTGLLSSIVEGTRPGQHHAKAGSPHHDKAGRGVMRKAWRAPPLPKPSCGSW